MKSSFRHPHAGEESIFGRAAPEEVAEHVRAVVRDLFPRR
jgi:hypothetical protein